MKKLPIGISTFEKIISGNYLYIDKTEFALQIIENGEYYFLSRPRRFGKSLFIDTLQCIFEGKKELFNGLHIYDKYDFVKYPVIKIGFSGANNEKELIGGLLSELNTNRKYLQLDVNSDDYAIYFSELIQAAYDKYQMPVVVLVDEYDKPILDVIENYEQASKHR